MDTPQPRDISVLEPIGAAFEKTQQILFQPFDIGKWFVLGFAAWLATLWERGGGGGGGGFNYNVNHQSGDIPPEVGQQIDQVKDAVVQYLPVIISFSIVILVIVLAVSVVMLWLKSRFQFVFLRNVAHNNTEITRPWRQYARQGNSLFWFKLALGLIGAIITIALIIPVVFIVIGLADSEFAVLAAIFPLILAGLALFCLFLVFAAIGVLTKDFVVPIMYLQDCTIGEGWKRFWRLARRHKGVFLLFLLAVFVLNIAIAAILGFGMGIACCCFCCISWIFLIPVAGGYFFTVLTLPLWVWRRSFSALFLAQFGPEYDVFAEAGQIVVPSDLVPPNETS